MLGEQGDEVFPQGRKGQNLDGDGFKLQGIGQLQRTELTGRLGVRKGQVIFRKSGKIAFMSKDDEHPQASPEVFVQWAEHEVLYRNRDEEGRTGLVELILLYSEWLADPDFPMWQKVGIHLGLGVAAVGLKTWLGV